MSRLIPTATTITYATRILIAPNSGASLEDSELSLSSSLNADLLPTVAGTPYAAANRNVTGSVTLSVVRDYASQFEAMSAKKDEEAFAAANPTGALTLATADPASGGVSMTAYTAALASLTHTLTSAGSSKVRLISEWDLTYADLSLPAPADWDGYGVNQLLNVLTEMRKTAGPPGATFTPHMSAQGVLSWTNDGNLSNPAPVSLRGPQGNSGLVDYRPLLETIFNPKLQLTDEPAASTARQTVLWTELRAHASHFSTPILLRSLRLYAAATPAKNPLVLTLWEELREEWTWRACSLPATVSGGTVTEFTFDPPVPVNGSALRFGCLAAASSAWPADNSGFVPVSCYVLDADADDESFVQTADAQYCQYPRCQLVYSTPRAAAASSGGSDTGGTGGLNPLPRLQSLDLSPDPACFAISGVFPVTSIYLSREAARGADELIIRAPSSLGCFVGRSGEKASRLTEVKVGWLYSPINLSSGPNPSAARPSFPSYEFACLTEAEIKLFLAGALADSASGTAASSGAIATRTYPVLNDDVGDYLRLPLLWQHPSVTGDLKWTGLYFCSTNSAYWVYMDVAVYDFWWQAGSIAGASLRDINLGMAIGSPGSNGGINDTNSSGDYRSCLSRALIPNAYVPA